MEIAEYLRALRVRWRWIAAGLLLGAIASIAVVVTTTPVYQASTQLFVSTRQADSGTDLYSGSSFSQQRVASYAIVVTTPRVLQPVIDRLGLGETPDELASRITVDAPVNSVLIDIAVRDTDAGRAATIANAVSDSFVTVAGQLERTATAPSPVSISSVRQAVAPSRPVLPDPVLDIALGLGLGLLLGVAVGLVRHATDTVIRDEQDLSWAGGTTVLGEIPFDRQAAGNPTLVRQPHGVRAEAFRSLRTNLRFVEAAGRLRSVVITSSVAREGKSTSAINLALAMVDSGLRVVIVDADLRRPRIAHYLGLIGTVGLTTVLLGTISPAEALQRWGGGQLYVLASGDIPPNPSELLGTPALADLVEQLEQDFDLVIFDAPPLLPVTDAALLSARTSGAVLLVGSGQVHRQELTRAMRVLDVAGVRTIGLVRNLVRVSGRRDHGYYAAYRPTSGRRWRLFRRSTAPAVEPVTEQHPVPAQ